MRLGGNSMSEDLSLEEVERAHSEASEKLERLLEDTCRWVIEQNNNVVPKAMKIIFDGFYEEVQRSLEQEQVESGEDELVNIFANVLLGFVKADRGVIEAIALVLLKAIQMVVYCEAIKKRNEEVLQLDAKLKTTSAKLKELKEERALKMLEQGVEGSLKIEAQDCETLIMWLKSDDSCSSGEYRVRGILIELVLGHCSFNQITEKKKVGRPKIKPNFDVWAYSVAYNVAVTAKEFGMSESNVMKHKKEIEKLPAYSNKSGNIEMAKLLSYMYDVNKKQDELFEQLDQSNLAPPQRRKKLSELTQLIEDTGDYLKK